MSKHNNYNKNFEIYLENMKSFDTSLLSKEEEEKLTKDYYNSHDKKTFEMLFYITWDLL